MPDDKLTFDLDNIPEDATVSTGSKSFDPIPDDTYQVLVKEAKLQQNIFYKPTAEQTGDKYTFSFTLQILDEGEFQGRLIWVNAGPSLKPMTKRGTPTKLYKIVNKVLGTEMDWDECAAFAPDMRTLYENILTKVVGSQARVTTESVTNSDTGKTRTTVASFAISKKDLPVPETSTVTGKSFSSSELSDAVDDIDLK